MELTNFRVLGWGGFSTVYVADEPALERQVAVKVLTVPFEDANEWGRFERECRAVGRLSGHPGVVTVHSAGRSPAGQGYLVMEYLPAGSLGAHLKRVGALGAPEAAAVATGVAAALVTTHELGVVHRDIKPENVLLTDRSQPKLADFGIAGLQSASGSMSVAEAFTPDHVAPEVIREESSGPAADVYSLCSTLYQLLTGSPPYRSRRGEPVMPMLMRKVSEPPPPLPAQVPVDLRRLVEEGMLVDPAHRPSLPELHERLRLLPHAPLWIPGEAPVIELPGVVPSPLDALSTSGGATTIFATTIPKWPPLAGAAAPGTTGDGPSPVTTEAPRRARRPARVAVAAATGLLVVVGATTAVVAMTRDGDGAGPSTTAAATTSVAATSTSSGPTTTTTTVAATTAVATTGPAVTVASPVLTALALGSPETLAVGTTGTVTLAGTLADGSAAPAAALAPAAWESSDASVLTVDATGTVAAVGAGEATVSATVGSVRAEAVVRVTGPGTTRARTTTATPATVATTTATVPPTVATVAPTAAPTTAPATTPSPTLRPK